MHGAKMKKIKSMNTFEMNAMKTNLDVVETLPLVGKKNHVPHRWSVSVTINRGTYVKQCFLT